MRGTFGCFSHEFPNKHARHPAYQLIFVYAESGPPGLRPASGAEEEACEQIGICIRIPHYSQTEQFLSSVACTISPHIPVVEGRVPGIRRFW